MSLKVPGCSGNSSDDASSESNLSYCDVEREYPAVSNRIYGSGGDKTTHDGDSSSPVNSPRDQCSRLVIKKFEKLFPIEYPFYNRKWSWVFNATTLISGIVFFTNPVILTKIFVLTIGVFSRDLAIIAGSQTHKKIHIEGIPDETPIVDAFHNTWLIHRIVRFFD